MGNKPKRNPRYDFSKKPEEKTEKRPSSKQLEVLCMNLFKEGQETVQRHIKSILSDISRWQRGLDRDVHLIGSISSTQQSFWYLTEDPLLTIHGGRGVHNSRLEEAAQGIKSYVIDHFGLNIGIELEPESRTVNHVFMKEYGKQQVIEIPSTDTISDFIELYSDEIKPKGHLIVTERSLKRGLGVANLGVGIVSTDASDLRQISAHEFMHAMDLEHQKYTKDPGNNCVNDCLMRYTLRVDGKLCSTCEDCARAYIRGIDSELSKYGRKITK